MSNANITEKATNVRRTVGVEVVADVGERDWCLCRHPTEDERIECYIKRLKRAIREFELFVKDHRSQDHVQLHVKEDMRDTCSVCREVWETVLDEGVRVCASCGAIADDGRPNASS